MATAAGIVGGIISTIKILHEKYKGRKLKDEIKSRYNDDVLNRIIREVYNEVGIEGIKRMMHHCRDYITSNSTKKQIKTSTGKKRANPIAYIRNDAVARTTLDSTRNDITDAVIFLINEFKSQKLDDRINKLMGFCLGICKKDKNTED